MSGPTTVLINCSNLRIGGGLQVAHSFLNQLRSFESDWQFVVTLSSELGELVETSEFPSSFHFVDFTIKPSWWKTFSGLDQTLNRLVQQHNVAAAFSPFGPTYWKPQRIPHLVGYAKPHYVIRNAQFYRKIGWTKRVVLAIKEALHMSDFHRNNDCLVTENRAISDLLSKRLQNKTVHTVTNTYNPNLFESRRLGSRAHVTEFRRHDPLDGRCKLSA